MTFTKAIEHTSLGPYKDPFKTTHTHTLLGINSAYWGREKKEKKTSKLKVTKQDGA